MNSPLVKHCTGCGRTLVLFAPCKGGELLAATDDQYQEWRELVMMEKRKWGME